MKLKFNFCLCNMFNRIISIIVLLTIISTNITSQSLTGYGDSMPKGFDPGVADFHFSRADREITAERWMEEAKTGIQQAQISWERMAFELYSDPEEFAGAKRIIAKWSMDEIEKRFAQWIVKRFFGTEYSSVIEDVSEKIKSDDIKLLFNLDDEGNIIFDKNTGDPMIIRPDERDFSSDLEARRNQIITYMESGLTEYQTRIEAFYPELLNYIDEENRSSFIDKLRKYSIESSDSLKRDMIEMNKREEQLFAARRTGDIFSLRRKSDSESAGAISAELIYNAEKICDEGIASIEEKIEQARAGVGELALAGEEWLLAYQEEFNRGLKAWEEAEERFFIRRIEWEQETGKQYDEGEETWALAFNRLSEEKNAWEIKSKMLFEQGEEMFKNASLVLQNAIKEAKIEFEKDAALRLQSGTERAGAWINTYITSGGIAASAQENVDFWLSELGESAKNAPKLSSGLFENWLGGRLTNETAALNSVLQSINEKRDRIYELNTEDGRNDAEIEVIKLEIGELNEQKKLYEKRINAKNELKKWSDMYKKYLAIAVEARDALVNEFSLVMGNGALADILSGNVTSEDFNLDEYQIELIRAKAVSSYWEKRVNIAKAVNDYAVELNAGRLTDSEGFNLWEKSKTEYEEALLNYENAHKKLSEVGDNITGVKEELIAASAILQGIDARLNKLNSEYSALLSIKAAGNKKVAMLELAEKYKELIKQNGLYRIEGGDAIYINYIERARELGFAEYLEANGKILKEVVAGNSSGSKSLAELYTEYDEIWVPENVELVSSNIETYHIETNNNYYSIMNNLLNERNKIISSNEAIEDKDEIFNEYDNLILKTANAAKNSVKRKYDAGISTLNLLTASSTEDWYKSEYGITGDVTFEYGVEYQLYYDAAQINEELNTAFDILSNQGYPTYLCYIILDDLIAKSERAQYLLEAYQRAKNSASSVIEEQNLLALKDMKALFLAYGIETSVYSLPAVNTAAKSLFNKEGDIAENLAGFLYDLDICFSRMPSWIKSEASKWKEAFIAYFAARSIYYNKNSQLLKNDAANMYMLYAQMAEVDTVNSSQYYAAIGQLEYVMRFLDEIEKQRLIINNADKNKEKHWREYITASFLDEYNSNALDDEKVEAGIKGNPEIDSKIRAASNYTEGNFADKLEKAQYETSKLNEAINININNYAEKTNEAIKEVVDKYITDKNAEWLESDITKIEHIYKDRLSTEVSYLNKTETLMSILAAEIARLGSAYEKSASDAKIQNELNKIEADINALKQDYDAAMNNYGKAANKFAEKGNAYDKLYAESKIAYEKLEAARLEYEKQDAIRRWASTAYLEYDGMSGTATEQYNNPVKELAYSTEKYERSNVVLEALKDVYDKGETRRPFNNSVYNDLYEQYKKSFERLIVAIKVKSELEAAIKEEVVKNEQLYASYNKNIQTLGQPINISEDYSSPMNKSTWGIMDIITVKDGKLAFSYTGSAYILQGQTKEKADTLRSYFTSENMNDNETYLSSQYEIALRQLSNFLITNVSDENKYRQWSLARDYLVTQLQRNNSGIEILLSFYSRDSSLVDGNLSSQPAAMDGLEFDKVSDVRMSDGELLNIQMEAWNKMSGQEKQYLEFYIILTLMGGGGLKAESFNFETWIKECADVKDSAEWHKANVEDAADYLAEKAFLLAFIDPAGATACAISAGIAGDNARKLGETITELNKALDNYNHIILEGFNGLEFTSESIKESYNKYKSSCDRIGKLKGTDENAGNVEWTKIESSLKAAGKINASDIANLKRYWNEMNAGNSVECADVMEALSLLAQWSRGKREDIKRDLETEYSNEDENRNKKQKEYRELAQAYIEGAENMRGMEAALYEAYGGKAPAIKNHLENIESVLINNVSGVMTSGSAYMMEYTPIASEMLEVTARAYQARYAAELSAREAEWEQQLYDIERKLKAWREAAEIILARGRDDWKRGEENMRARYSAWKKEFKEEYERTSVVWDSAYLAGLEDKAVWAAKATEAANDAAGIEMLELIGADAEKKARGLETRDPLLISAPDGILAAEKSLKELLNSAGIRNSAAALAAGGGAALTVPGSVRAGVGGINTWDTGMIQVKASRLAKDANEELAAREAKILAANVMKMAEGMTENLKEYVKEANKNFDESMDRTFVVGGRWSRRGNTYTNEILVASSVISGGRRESAAVEAYRYYEMEAVTLRTDISEGRLSGLESFAIQALIQKIGEEIKWIQESIFGTERENEEYRNKSGEERGSEAQPGKFGKHIGYGPKTKENPDIKVEDISRDKVFEHRGAGELGRLMTEYIYWNYKETLGLEAMNSALWDKPLWDAYGSDFNPPTVRGVMEIATQVAATVVAAVAAPFTGGASLIALAALSTVVNMTDDALFAALDVANGYKEGSEVGEAFLKKSAVTFASSLVSSAFNGAGTFTGLTAQATGGISNGFVKAAAEAGMTGLQVMTSATVTSGINAINYNAEDGFSFSTETFLSGVGLEGGLTSSIAAMASSFTSGMLGNLNLGVGAMKVDGFNSGQIADIGGFNSFAGSMVGSAVTYGMSGNVTFNLAKVSGNIGGAEWSTGILEMNVGEDGFSMGIGSGGTDISAGTIAGAMSGLENWGKNIVIEAAAKRNEMKNIATGLRMQWGHGDAAALEQLEEVLRGETVLREGTGEGKGRTEIENGKRVVYIDGYSSDMSREEQLAMGILLQHEAYRDGVADGNNSLETVVAAKGHTEMMYRMASDARYTGLIGNIIANDVNLQQDAIAYETARRMGDWDIFADYVGTMYDSGADYWRVLKDADGNVVSILDDGNRNKVTIVEADGSTREVELDGSSVIGQLSAILGGDMTADKVNKIMMASGLDYDKAKGGWYAKEERGIYKPPEGSLNFFDEVVQKTVSTIDDLRDMAAAQGNKFSNWLNGILNSKNKEIVPPLIDSKIETAIKIDTSYSSSKFEQMQRIVNESGLMGKKYGVDDYVCTSFVRETLALMGIDPNAYVPSISVVETMEAISNANKNNPGDKKNLFIETTEGKNPEEGLYIFYKKYDEGSGHVGFVNFDSKGNATLLHNGYAGKDKPDGVNIYTRDNRDLDTFFTNQEKYRIKYIKL